MPNPLGISDEEYAQLEFYASMSGMTPEQYVEYQAVYGEPQMQAPQRAYEQKTGKSAIRQQARGLDLGQKDINDREDAETRAYFDNTVTPALEAQRTAAARQLTGNKEAEDMLRGANDTQRNELAATQAQRMSTISGANAEQRASLGAYTGQLDASNSAANAATGQYTGQLSAANARQNAALGTLQGQLQQSNAAETAAYGDFRGQLDRSNAEMNAANSGFQLDLQQLNERANQNAYELEGDMEGYNEEGDQNVASYDNALRLIGDDARTAYDRYLEQTNPMLAEMKARGSDEKYVAQQQGLFDEYKALSNPEVTAQERFLAEAARRKTEGDDKSSRDATYQQLQARGLNSGGQQIAAQLAARQATSQDRVLAELGVQANAVGRSERNRAGAVGVAAQLRGSDDAMRQFQDQYAQNDAVRRQNVAQGQSNTSMAYNDQRAQREGAITSARRTNINDKTGRSGMVFDANNAVVQGNTQRAGMGFDASANTINSNSNRDALGYQANTNMINNNSGRNIAGYNASSQTINDNSTRDGAAFGARTQTINDNSTRDTARYNARTGTTDTNFNRTMGGYDTADRNTGVNHAATVGLGGVITGNRASEAGTAGGVAGTSLAAFGGYQGMQQGLSQTQRDALNSMFGNQLLLQAEREYV